MKSPTLALLSAGVLIVGYLTLALFCPPTQPPSALLLDGALGAGNGVPAPASVAGLAGATQEQLRLEIKLLEELIALKEGRLQASAKSAATDTAKQQGARPTPADAGHGDNTAGRDPTVLSPKAAELQAFVVDQLKIPKGQTIILTTVTKGFLPSLINWMILLRRLDLSNIFIFAMDQESQEWLFERGVHAYTGSPEVDEPAWAGVDDGRKKIGGAKLSRMQVWYERSHIVLELLRLGYPVVQSDGDALILQNPFFELNSYKPEIDIIFSRGNARAGTQGRGTGVCMGFVSYRPTRGAQGFLDAVQKDMKLKSDVDQGIANGFLGRKTRDKDKYNTEPFYGVWNNTMHWVQIPQTRVARHGGLELADRVGDKIDLHVFHPADEGWRLPFKHLPQILPENLWNKPINQSQEIKKICNAGRWSERTKFSVNDQKTLACCGLWMLKDGWETELRKSSETFDQWLTRVSHLEVAKKYKFEQGKKAYLQP